MFRIYLFKIVLKYLLHLNLFNLIFMLLKSLSPSLLLRRIHLRTPHSLRSLRRLLLSLLRVLCLLFLLHIPRILILFCLVMTLIMLILPKVFLLLIRYRRLLETLQTGSDEEMAQAVMSDANMLNSSKIGRASCRERV